MRSASYGLIGLAIIVGILGLVNHFAIHAGPDHTSTVIGGVAVVLLVIGGAMMLTGRGSAS